MTRLYTIAWLLTLAIASPFTLATQYPLPPENSNLIGKNLYYTVPKGKLTLEDIAAQFKLGLSNMLEANPGVDPFLPRPGSKLLIPHQLILPAAPREGIIINLAEMRLYYYPKGKNIIEVLPIGIGDIGKDTPEDWITSIKRKRANPTWTPTERIRKEYADKGEILPKVWPAGPDNPMGLYALYIGNLYAIHGTNASFGIGLRVSQGCVRLRHDDIKHLFENVPIGTRVQFVNQPIKATTEPNGKRYLAVHEPLSRTMAEFESDEPIAMTLPKEIAQLVIQADVDKTIVDTLLNERTGIPTLINPQAL